MFFLLHIFQEKQSAPYFLNGQYHEITTVKNLYFFCLSDLDFKSF
jgi:hypothetical protein